MQELEIVGVAGLGLLGRGIVTCTIAHGFRVIAVDRDATAREGLASHVEQCLEELQEHGALKPQLTTGWRDRLAVEPSAEALRGADLIVESITENPASKQSLYDVIESAVSPSTTIASNTSAISITRIQKPRRHPQRFVGMHWAEPAHVMRFMEVIRGEQTSDDAFAAAVDLSRRLGKEPSLVRRDVQGFVANRMMYAMMREALHLLETGVADVETIDRSFRNDVGWWATIAGPFRWMDLTGIPAYAAVMQDLFPELSCTKTLPETMKRLVDDGALGIANGRGFYSYTSEQAQQWDRRWRDFTWDVRRLAETYLPAGEQSVDVARPPQET